MEGSHERDSEFPSREAELPIPAARMLFRMSSVLPAKIREAARGEGFRVNEQTRGFVFNADLVSIIRFLEKRFGPVEAVPPEVNNHFPRVVRLHSTDGGRTFTEAVQLSGDELVHASATSLAPAWSNHQYASRNWMRGS